MALVVFDRVQETTATTGTGTLTLGGAVAGFQSFAVVGNGNTTYYTIVNGSEWEVGIGTYTASGTTLSRDTVLSNSLGTTSPITLVGASNVFITYPASKSVNLNALGNVSPLGTISSGTWQGTTVGVAYGGTGVTSSSGANSVVLRDSNQNIVANKISQSVNNVTATGGTTILTASSAFWETLQGTGPHTFVLPDATTLPVGFWYVFDNDSTGNLTVQDFATATLDTVPPGGYSLFYLDDNSTVAGGWNRAGLIPSEVNWGTNSLDLGGLTVVTNGTWQGTPIASGYGGTGLTTFTSANNALYSTSASALTAGTLPVAAGGTGATTANANTVFAGPTTGGAAAPSFRALVAADIPSSYSQFASGTALLFYQAAAPTGWTKVTTQDNKALRVVSGTGGGSGGSVAFTTAFASQTPSGSVSTNITGINGSVSVSISNVTGTVSISGGSVSATTLTTDQIPAHTHAVGTLVTGNNSVDHSHTYSGGTGGVNANHSHLLTSSAVGANQAFLLGAGGQVTFGDTSGVNGTQGQSNDHAHGFSGTTSGQSTTHNHSISGNTGNNTTTGASHTHGFTNPTGTFSYTGSSLTSGFTFNSGTATSAFTGSAINLAVQYIDVIICTKD